MDDHSLPSAYEDMLFFERRLTEVVSGMQLHVRRWRAVLIISLLLTTYSAYYWISDPSLKVISFWESLLKHPLFAMSVGILLALIFIFQIHKRVVAHKIIVSRCREVLSGFCLSCDEQGKLIVRPTYNSSSLVHVTNAYSQPSSITEPHVLLAQ